MGKRGCAGGGGPPSSWLVLGPTCELWGEGVEEGFEWVEEGLVWAEDYHHHADCCCPDCFCPDCHLGQVARRLEREQIVGAF